jgi:two-component system response regulator
MPDIHMLVVEDNPGDVELIRLAFKHSRVANRIDVVEDGEEALQYVRRSGRFAGVRRPDLIILDLNLPKVDGREVLEAIKADSRLKDIPVIVLTTSYAQHDVTYAYEHYANCYLTKPADVEEFLKKVRAIETFWLTLVRLPNA